jgi:hypothetical protein
MAVSAIFSARQRVDYRGLPVAAAAGQNSTAGGRLSSMNSRNSANAGPITQSESSRGPVPAAARKAGKEFVDVTNKELEAISVYGHCRPPFSWAWLSSMMSRSPPPGNSAPDARSSVRVR